MLIAKKRLIVASDTKRYVEALFRHDGIVEEPVSATIALYAASLPPEFHGDPADRIIVATAAVLAVPLVTRDARIVAYLRKTRLAPVVTC